MMSIQSWYTRIFNAQAGTKARSKDVREEFDLIVSAFNKIQGVLKIADTQAPPEQTLDYSALQRANMLIGFNAAGNLEIIQGAFTYRGNWATATAYKVNDIFRDPTAPNSVYVVAIAHTSGVLATDIAALKDVVIIDMSAVATQVAAAAASAGAASASAAAALASQGAAATSAASAATAPGTSGTSATSMSVATGAKACVASAGKAWVPGMAIACADTAAPSSNAMYGTIDTYDSGTGALTFTSRYIVGSGTKTAWIISVIGATVAAPAALLASWYGDGADGDAVVSAGTTTLTRSMRYNNLTINGTGKIDPAGYAIYVNGILDLTAAPADAISRTPSAGGAAALDVAGASTATIAEVDVGGNVSAGLVGKAGGINTGTAGTKASSSAAALGGLGGASGAGGTGTGGGGTAGAAAAAPDAVTTQFNPTIGQFLMSSLTLLSRGGSSGSSGGSGQGDSVNKSGASGGSGLGGGVLQLRARTIARGAGTAAGAISSKGSAAGVSGNAAAAGNPGGGGGSGGGGGGFIDLMYNQLTGTVAANAIDVSGGAGGTAGTKTGTGTDGAGGTGGQGGGLRIIDTVAGTVTYTPPSVAGSAPAGRVGGAGGVMRANL